VMKSRDFVVHQGKKDIPSVSPRTAE
jgi:hypothetical protein